MANRASTTHVIEIESGIGEPAFIPLTLGQELQPISIGKKGMWRVDGARVLDVHAFVYFDGASLFLQSADETACATVDGYNIGKAWTELHAPCKIEVGAARLRFRSLMPTADGHATQAAPPRPQGQPSGPSQPPRGQPAHQPPAAGAPAQPMSFPKPERPFRPGEFASADDESTRLAPLEGTAANRIGTSGSHPRPREEDPATRPEAARVSGPMAARASGAPQAYASGNAPIVQHPMSGGMGAMPPGAPMSGMGPAAAPGMSAPGMPVGMQQPGGSYPMAAGSGSYPQQPPYPGPGGSGVYGAMPGGSGMMPQGSLPPGGYGSMTQGQPAPEPQGFDKFVAQYKEMSVPKRLFVILLPLAMGLTVWSLWDEDEPPPRPKKAAHADAGAPMGSAAHAGSSAPTGTTPPVMPTAPSTPATGGTAAPWPSNVPCPPPGWPPNVPLPCTPNNAPTSTGATTPTPTTEASGKPHGGAKDAGAPLAPGAKDAGAPLAPGAKTLERQAVDAVAAGDYTRAAALYEELSRREPTNRVYSEAARILRARLDGGAP